MFSSLSISDLKTWMPSWLSRDERAGYAVALAGAGAAGLILWRGFDKHDGGSWPPGSCYPVKSLYQKKKVASAVKRYGYKDFPPPYPNGWVFVCYSKKLKAGGVLPIDVCGRRLVLFRASDGKVGVLDAFCPHMGTHLGYGGVVRGGNLVCPYHLWQFNRLGELQSMSFGGRATAEKGAAKCNTKGYPTYEKHGHILVWLHADDEEPWDPDVLDYPTTMGLRPICKFTDDDMMMHCMEPSHNSADWFHFSTVHSAMGQHWLSRWKIIHADHILHPARCSMTDSKNDDGTPIVRPERLLIDEQLERVRFFGGLFTVPGTLLNRHIQSQVRFSGPLISVFVITTSLFGKLVLYFFLTPTEPFVTHVEWSCFADRRWPWILAYVLAKTIRYTANQDREVWEHRAHGVRNTVKGDYDYDGYFRWLGQFYSKSSTTWDTAYEDLTW